MLVSMISRWKPHLGLAHQQQRSLAGTHLRTYQLWAEPHGSEGRRLLVLDRSPGDSRVAALAAVDLFSVLFAEVGVSVFFPISVSSVCLLSFGSTNLVPLAG